MEDFERKYYVWGGESPSLPHGEKAHFMACCYEYEELKMETKVVDLAYLVAHGYDLPKAVRNYHEEHPEYSTSIAIAFNKYIKYLRGEDAFFVLNSCYYDDLVTLNQIVETCSRELKQRYGTTYEKSCKDGQYHTLPCVRPAPAWNFDQIVKLKKWEKSELVQFFLLTTDEMLQKVEEMSV